MIHVIGLLTLRKIRGLVLTRTGTKIVGHSFVDIFFCICQVDSQLESLSLVVTSYLDNSAN